MSALPPSTLDAIKDRKKRAKLEALLKERAAGQFTFSWRKLQEFMEAVIMRYSQCIEDTPGEFQWLMKGVIDCIATAREDGAKQFKDALNHQIADILSDYDIKTLRQADTFDRWANGNQHRSFNSDED